jgi:HD-like signal output (HDOD) protein
MADAFFGNKRFKPATTSVVPGNAVTSNSQAKTQTRIAISESEVLTEVDRIPALSDVVTKIIALVGSQQASATGLENLIKRDMVIAGRLLKLVNSPFYGLKHPVATIAQAVTIIGISSLKSLVIAASASNLMVVDLTPLGFAPEGLWRNSMITAELARAIALQTGVSKDEAEDYFLGGMMRDVGMLVSGTLMAKYQVTLRQDPTAEGDLIDRERALMGFDHAWVGSQIAEKWRLPASLTMTIGKHHRIPNIITPGETQRLATIRLAERLAYHTGSGLLPDHPFETHIDGALITAACLDAAKFQAFMAEIPRLVASAEQSLA